MIARTPLIITLNVHCLSSPCLETKVCQNCKTAQLGYRQCAHTESEWLSFNSEFLCMGLTAMIHSYIRLLYMDCQRSFGNSLSP
jgi:hypothetical protein